MHQHDRRRPASGDVEAVWVMGQRRDVVDDTRAGVERCLDDRAILVSIDTAAPSSASARTTGSTRRTSSPRPRASAPGRVDSPPTSTISAPLRGARGPWRLRSRPQTTAAIRKAVRCYIEDAHDKRAVEADPAHGARCADKRRSCSSARRAKRAPGPRSQASSSAIGPVTRIGRRSGPRPAAAIMVKARPRPTSGRA